MALPSLQPLISEVPTAPPRYPSLSPKTAAALRKGRIVEAVRLICLKRNIGLSEAKDVIDTYLRSQPALKNRLEETQADAREGLLRWLIFLSAGSVGLAYLL